MKALLITLLITSAAADELKFRFKSPTFNGAGYSAHMINLENMRYSRKKSMRDELRALELQAQILEDRKPINAFYLIYKLEYIQNSLNKLQNNYLLKQELSPELLL